MRRQHSSHLAPRDEHKALANSTPATTRSFPRYEDVSSSRGARGLLCFADSEWLFGHLHCIDIRELHLQHLDGLFTTGEGDVEAAFDRIMASAKAYAPDARIEGVLVQKMMPKGHEIVIGITRDPDFGPLVMLGSGGIYLEVLKDVVFAPPPELDARRMTNPDAHRLGHWLRLGERAGSCSECPRSRFKEARCLASSPAIGTGSCDALLLALSRKWVSKCW